MKSKLKSGRKIPVHGARGAELLGPNSEIGRKLRQYYDEIVQDEVPDRFAQLLRRLEEAEPVAGKE